MTLTLIAIGGALGSVLRYLVGVFAARTFGPGFPFGTLCVNVLGSFVMGIAFVLIAERFGETKLAPFFMTGFLGGFTTFSAFSLDAVTLMESGRMGAAFGYVMVSVLVSIAALLLGVVLARSFGT